MKPSFRKVALHAIGTLALWLGALQVAFGGGGAPMPVKVLVDNAGAVVIATILDGTVVAKALTLSLEVQEALKGPLQAGTVVQVNCRLSTEAAAMAATGVDKDRGVFFLRNTNGKWSIVPVTSGFIPEFRGAFFVLPLNARPKTFGSDVQPSIHERILAEVAGALETRDSRLHGGFVDFMWEYRSNPSPAMKALFAQFRSSTNDQLRTIGLRVSVANGDDQAFAEFQKGLATQAATVTAQMAEDIQYYFNATDPQSVAKLGRLVTSQSSPAGVRKASLTALARVHTRESLPYLAGFLDNPDAELQSLAVGGLAMFANNVPAGGHEPASGPWKYRTEETIRYSVMAPTIIKNSPGVVAFWQSWWTEHRSELQ
jgi:hypothetical protein